MMVRNNEEIVGEVIEHLISQGLELVVLDNGSTDKTYEICEKHDAVNTHIKKLLKEDPSKKIAHQLLTKYMDDSKWNYKTKFTPYDTDTPPKRDEIFTKEGYLKVPQKTNLGVRRRCQSLSRTRWQV